MANAEDVLLEALQDLESKELKSFTRHLTNGVEGFDRIGRGLLENAGREEIVDKMVERYKISGAVKITLTILKKIHKNRLAQKLEAKLSRGGSAGTATPNPNPEKTLLGHCKENLCAGAEGFVPEMIEHKKNNLHRFQCPHDGQFQCRLTNLVFDMKGKGEVRYRIDSWDTSVLDRLGQMKPAGPLYDIDCFERSINYLYLPHCEILTENQAELAVAHFTNGNLEIIEPLKVTNTHVIIAIEDLSLFGLIYKIFFAGPIDAQVLFFYRPVAENLREMHIHLLPGNVPLTEVKNQNSDFANVTTSSNCELTPGRKYSPSCDTLIPRPQVVTFKRNYGPNYYPSFVVFVETVSVTVSLLDESGIQVWEPHLIFLAGGSAGTATPNPNPGGSSSAVTPTNDVSDKATFIDDKFVELVEKATSMNAVLDILLSKKVINDEQYNDIGSERTDQQKMRRLIREALKASGASGKAVLYDALMVKQPYMMKDLGAP